MNSNYFTPPMVLFVILPRLSANPIFMTKTKTYWLCQITGWLGMVAIEVINFTFFIVGKFSLEYLLFFLTLALVGVVLTHALKLLLARLNFFQNNSTFRIWLGALLYTLTLSLLMTCANIGINTALGVSLSEQLTPISLLGLTLNWMRYVGVWVIIYFLYKIMDINAALKQEKLSVETLAKSAELELLRSQLNPHFLFNALNSIKALISIDPEKSREAIVLLGEILRFTLNYGQEREIALQAEIEEVQKYLQLEQIRFGAGLAINWQIEDQVRHQVIPPGILLTLVENAIKHGQVNAQGLIELRIGLKLFNDAIQLEVANSGTWQPDTAHRGVGLRLVQRRLEAIYGTAAHFAQHNEPNAVLIQITLPKQLP